MRRLFRNPPLVWSLLLALVLLVAMALPSVVDFGDYATVQKVRAPLAPGEDGFILGSDLAGRNLLPRVLVGMRLTLLVGLGVLLLRAVLALPLGLLAGWRGGWLARVVSATAAGASAVPTLIVVALVLRIFSSVLTLSRPVQYLIYAAALVLVGLPRLADQIANLAGSVKNMPHVEAALSLGATQWRIITRHLFPVIRGDLLAALAAELALVLVAMGHMAIFDASAVIGGVTMVQLEYGRYANVELVPELGAMMGLSKGLIRYYWWPAVVPAVALGLIIACFQLLADGLRRWWLRRA